MNTLALLLVIYAVGLVLVLAAAFWAANREDTTHGRAILIQMGFAIAVMWPIDLLYFACVGIFLLVRRGLRAVREWLR